MTSGSALSFRIPKDCSAAALVDVPDLQPTSCGHLARPGLHPAIRPRFSEALPQHPDRAAA